MAWPLLAGLLLGLGACARDHVSERPEPVQDRPAAEAPAPRMDIVPSPLDPIPVPPVTATDRDRDGIILTPPPGVRRTVLVGLLLPLSGPEAATGRAMLEAAELALFDIADDDFVLLPRDTRGTPEGAVEATISALEDGARLLLGPLFSGSVQEAAPLARAAGLPVIAFSNDQAAAREDAFVLGFRPEAAVRHVVGYAASQGHVRFAALLPDDAFGVRLAEAFREAVAAAGAETVRIETYRPGAESMSDAVRRLGAYDRRRAALVAQRRKLAAAGDAISLRELRRLEGRDTLGDPPFDTVLLAESGRMLTALAPLLPFYDIDPRRVRVLGIDRLPGTELLREPALAGAWFAGPSPDTRKDFEARYRETFRRAPHPLGPLAYDAAALAAVLAAQPGGPDFSLRALTAPNGFAGTAGTFRLLSNGLVERHLAVMELRPNGMVVISPARDSFEAPAF